MGDVERERRADVKTESSQPRPPKSITNGAMLSSPHRESDSGFHPGMPRQPLGTIIFQRGMLTADQLLQALEEGQLTHRRLGDIVVERGWLGELELAEALAEQYGLTMAELGPAEVDAEARGMLAPEDEERLGAMVIGLEVHVPVVAVSDPSNAAAVTELETLLGGRPRFVVATPSAIAAARTRSAFTVAADEPETAATPVHLPEFEGPAPAPQALEEQPADDSSDDGAAEDASWSFGAPAAREPESSGHADAAPEWPQPAPQALDEQPAHETSDEIAPENASWSFGAPPAPEPETSAQADAAPEWPPPFYADEAPEHELEAEPAEQSAEEEAPDAPPDDALEVLWGSPFSPEAPLHEGPEAPAGEDAQPAAHDDVPEVPSVLADAHDIGPWPEAEAAREADEWPETPQITGEPAAAEPLIEAAVQPDRDDASSPDDEPEPTPETTAGEDADAVLTVVLRLSTGDIVELGPFRDEAEARARAEELVGQLAAEDGAAWTSVDGRWLRPWAVVAVEIASTG
jgi:hypothetical protein